MKFWVKNHTSKSPSGRHASTRTLEGLFRVQHGPLLRFVLARVKDQNEAEEIVQEAFVRFQKKYDPTTVDSPAALLARIAANLVIDRVRERDARAAREDAWGKLYTEGADGDASASKSVDPARALSARQQVELAMSVLEGLPQKTRQVFLLHRVEGLSHSEISSRIGMPKSTIEKHMIRAIKALAKIRED
ncbi:MAG: RNA polymerase sigma factor [Kordiimonas sp.]